VAVAALVTVAKDTEAPTSSRVSAARAILEFAMRAVEIDDFEERLAVLEAALETKVGGNRK